MGRIKAVLMRYRDATGHRRDESVPSLKDIPAWITAPMTDEQIRQMGDDSRKGGGDE